ncbi:hypothetical protein LJC30_05235, partial [Odoribacter sp. OttesenSCG-928-L07]|nr:hypothetical protein [Odoribacter sp. OttesenSCG-928-L07]
MSDIIKTDKIITLSSARETKIRNAINKWAQNILYHDHRTLGSKLKIIEAYESPFYLMRLWSETDNRFVTETYTSNIPQQIGERKYSSINEVNVWAFNYDIPDAFSKSTETDRIKNSEHLKNCLKCGALGTVTCSCKTGTVTCPNCKGGQITKSRDVSCSVCKGKGKINRTIKVTEPTPGWSPTSSGPKNQTVTKTVSENCKTCRGSGKVKENYSERCPKCNGTAKIVCPTCRGKKVIKCTTCNG